jgi:ketosteroid isomerase-like protein
VQTFLDPALEEAIDSYYAAIAAQRLPDWLALLSPTVMIHEPAGVPPAEGHDGAAEAWKVLTAPFRSLDFERVRTFFSGSGVAVFWRSQARGVNGGSAAAEGITIFEFDDEARIETVVSYWDPAALLIALAEGEEGPLH